VRNGCKQDDAREWDGTIGPSIQVTAGHLIRSSFATRANSISDSKIGRD
jgi:hypothetical protein